MKITYTRHWFNNHQICRTADSWHGEQNVSCWTRKAL